MRAVLLGVAVAAGPVLGQATIDVPSGQPVSLIETVWGEPGPTGLTLRFRFLAPEIARDGGAVDFETAAEDMAYLCEAYALPRLSELGARPSQIVISLSDRPLPFGTADPEATQFFEAYSPEGDRCIWEGF
ncbi:DUF6497 family protein [Rhodovulum iodosum]|uniref:DUF6497 family protein n=1 Tax=Rhodovulum iodosum TaxID=68291 RepID=UPI001FE69D05|nr:DUF6497 family protein [Rhodovulum robiginosum]